MKNVYSLKKFSSPQRVEVRRGALFELAAFFLLPDPPL
jgi:hypothetical protein